MGRKTKDKSSVGTVAVPKSKAINATKIQKTMAIKTLKGVLKNMEKGTPRYQRVAARLEQLEKEVS